MHTILSCYFSHRFCRAIFHQLSIAYTHIRLATCVNMSNTFDSTALCRPKAFFLTYVSFIIKTPAWTMASDHEAKDGLLCFNLRTTMGMGHGGRFNTGRVPRGWLFNGGGVFWRYDGDYLKAFYLGIYLEPLCERGGWFSVLLGMGLHGGQIACSVFSFGWWDYLRLSIMIVRWYARRLWMSYREYILFIQLKSLDNFSASYSSWGADLVCRLRWWWEFFALPLGRDGEHTGMISKILLDLFWQYTSRSWQTILLFWIK